MTEEIYRHEKPAALGELDLSTHGVIEASAGTGKTYTLEHLIIDIVLETATPIDEILVVTFTRRATAEMTERVRRRFRALIRGAEQAGVSGVPTLDHQGELFEEETEADASQPVWAIDAEGLRRLKRALNDFGRAPIHTIHSFCQRVLQEYAFSNRRLFEEEHVDDRRLFEEVFFETLRTDFATEPELRSWLEAYLQLVDNDIDDLADSLYEDHRSRAELQPRPATDERRKMLAAIRDGEGDSVDEEMLEVEARTTLLGAVESQLRRRKERDGLFTYDDMLGLVWENLRGERGDELADAIRDRFRYALVDEFQDTDPVQWKIFRKLFLQGRRNHLFVIGDPKQAIYGFRGADVDTYQDAAREVQELGERIELNTNYRSTAELIDAYNSIFDQSVEEPFFGGERFSYDEPVDCGVEELRLVDDPEGKDQPVAAIELLEPTGAEDWKSKDVRRTLREGIAEEIEAILSGEHSLWLSKKDSDQAPKQVAASDIFVLTHSRVRGEEIGDALDARDIPYAFYRKEGLFETDEAVAIRDVLRGVARPDRRSWRLQAYNTPFFDLSLAQLERADEMEGPQSPRRMLDDWHDLAEDGRFERLFDRLIDESGLARRLLLFEQSERKLTNLRHIFEILAEEVHRGEHDAASLTARLTAFIEQRAAPEGEDTDLQRLESDREAVQIMTIHKAKGLEAPVVFLYGGLNRSTHAGRTYKTEKDGERQKLRFTSRGAMTAAQKRRADEHFESEARRLMYVAITRGVGRVYLPYLDEKLESACGRGDFRGKYAPVNRRLQTLVPALSSANDETSELFARREIQFRQPTSTRHSEPDLDAWRSWSIPEWLRADPTDDEFFEQLKEGRFRTITSFTRMTAHGGASETTEGDRRDRATTTDVGGADAAETDRIDRTESNTQAAATVAGGDGAPEVHVPGGIRTGLLVHSLLEQVDRARLRRASSFEDWIDSTEVESMVDRFWRQYPLADQHRSRVERMVWWAMTEPLEVLAETSMSEVDAMQREVSFHFPIPEDDHPPLGQWRSGPHADVGSPEVRDGFVTGEIDVLFEHEGSVWVADWKTNISENYSSAALRQLVDEQYREQVLLYSMAAAKMLGVSDEEALAEQLGGVVYLFVRGMGGQDRMEPSAEPEPRQFGVAEVTPDWSQLVSFADRIGQLTAGDQA